MQHLSQIILHLIITGATAVVALVLGAAAARWAGFAVLPAYGTGIVAALISVWATKDARRSAVVT